MSTAAARFAAAVLGLAALAAPAAAGEGEVPEVATVRKVLKNGLRVVVHEDRKAPVVAVNVWYHVGSKNERPGRTGFAHLFEHLMFNGSENANDDWFQAMARLGATGVNGTTNNDRTNYFETVPATALDTVLWLEADRMGRLLGAVDQAKLDEQRGVVQNEKRQGENEPLGRVWNLLPGLSYPPGHPYSWSVIGSMEDLDAAKVEDVHAWFKAYYGAANAVLVVAGDVRAEEALAKIERHFGDVPPGPPVTRPEGIVARRSGTTRWSTRERVPDAHLVGGWNVPGWGTRDALLLDVAAGILGRGEGSRLHRRLVWKERLATEAEADLDVNEIGSQFYFTVKAAPGADLARVEAVLREEIAALLADGPSEEELATEKTRLRAALLRRLERVGGFGGKSDLLAESEVYGGRPDAWRDHAALVAAATRDDVRAAAREWLADGLFVMEILPWGEPAAAPAPGDREKTAPAAPPPPAAKFPELQRATLPHGLEVILARRPGVPVVRADLLVRAGYAADPKDLPGTARLVGNLLAGGTKERSALDLRRKADALGAEIRVETELEWTRVGLSAIPDRLDGSLEVLADMALRPDFPAAEIEVHRAAQASALAAERMDARGLSQRVLGPLLYGPGHPYGIPLTGTGTEASLARIAREDLRAHHGTWFRPGNATLVVAGDLSMADLLPLVRKHFGGWEKGSVPARAEIPAPPEGGKSRIWLLDRPGAPQSSITAAQFVPARGGDGEAPLEVLHAVLGGMFTSRLNMNLREDKHWAYGAGSRIRSVRGPRPLVAGAGVQTDRTAESVAEILKEFRGLAGAKPVTEAEREAAVATLTLTLPGRWETGRAVSESVQEIVLHGLPERWFDGQAERIRAVDGKALAAAGALLRPDHLVWIVVGDRRKIEAGLRALGIGEVTVLDADGRPVE